MSQLVGNKINIGLSLRVHEFVPHSRANGPGTRAVLWVQGCSLGCPGCFNEPTHEVTGDFTRVDDLFERIVVLPDIEGLTISGGEPLQQRPGVTRLLERVRRETALSTVLFTGFSWEELERMGQAERRKTGQAEPGRFPLPVLEYVDVLIAGRYELDLRIAQDLRGSSNKKLYFLTDRYNEADFQAVPRTEIMITPEGEVILSGIDPLKW